MTTTTKDSVMVGKQGINNNSILSGSNVMPMKGQHSNNGNQFLLMRQIFQRTDKNSPPNHDSTHRGKNTVYQDNSQYLLKKKSLAVGKQSYNSPLSFNSNPINDVKNAVKRVRSSGAVPPPKKSM